MRWKPAYVLAAALLSVTLMPAAAQAAEEAGTFTNAQGDSCLRSVAAGRTIESCDRVERTENLTREKPLTPAALRVPLVERDTAVQVQRHDPVQALDLPAECQGIANPDRMTACSRTSWRLTRTRTINGVTRVVGTLDWQIESWVFYTRSCTTCTSATWALSANINTKAGWGELLGGTDARLYSGCFFSTVCSTTSSTLDEGSVISLTPFTTDSGVWSQKDSGNVDRNVPGSIDFLDQKLGVRLQAVTPPQWVADDAAAEGNTLRGRCDNIAGGRGCVNYTSIEAYGFSAVTHPKVDEVAQHVFWAQTGGLPVKWGVPGEEVLTRTTDPQDEADSRAIACPPGGTPTGRSCDEWPMATTYQSAAFEPAGRWSVRYVIPEANDSQGGLTSSYYNQRRIIDADPFYIWAQLKDGTYSW